MYTLQGRTWSTRHTLFTLGLRMALDHMYLTWSAYSNLSWDVNRVGRMHCSREKVLLTPPLSPTEWPTRPTLVSLPTQPLKQCASTCWWQANRLTGPISPACDRYTQYLLTGANPSALNWHRQGLQPWRCRLGTSHSPTFPTDGPPLSTQGPCLVFGYPSNNYQLI
jgi:hypothetical protein